MRSILFVSMLAAVALTGCTTTEGHHDTGITVTASGLPTTGYAGQALPLTVTATDEGSHTSSHIGAHYWTSTQTDPTATIGDGLGCAHVDGTVDVAGAHTATCTFAEPGTYYVYGHVRVVEGDDTFNFWSEPLVIEVIEGYTLATQELAESSSMRLNMELTVDGPAGATTHIGGHYWTEAQADPTATIGDGGGCNHAEGETTLPTTLTVTCEFAEAGTYQVYGHLRVVLDGVTYNFWAEALEFTAVDGMG